MNSMLEVIMRNEVGWALNRLIECPPTSTIDHSDPEMVHRFTEVASSYLHQGFELKSIEREFAQEITRQVDTVKYVDHFLIAGLLMRLATEGLNTALRMTLAEKRSFETDVTRDAGNPSLAKIVWQGTAREFGDDIQRRWECGEITAKSRTAAFDQQCALYLQSNGKPMNAKSILQSLKNRQEVEGK